MDRRLFMQVAAALVAAVNNPTTPLLGQGRKPQPAETGDGWRKWRIKVVVENGWATYHVDGIVVKERPWGGKKHVPEGKFECEYDYYEYDHREEPIEVVHNATLLYVESRERWTFGTRQTLWRAVTHMIETNSHRQMVRSLV